MFTEVFLYSSSISPWEQLSCWRLPRPYRWKLRMSMDRNRSVFPLILQSHDKVKGFRECRPPPPAVHCSSLERSQTIIKPLPSKLCDNNFRYQSGVSFNSPSASILQDPVGCRSPYCCLFRATTVSADVYQQHIGDFYTLHRFMCRVGGECKPWRWWCQSCCWRPSSIPWSLSTNSTHSHKKLLKSNIQSF